MPTDRRVVSISEAQENLDFYLDEFEKHGIDAEPIAIGENGKAQVILMPYAQIEVLMEHVDELAESIASAREETEKAKSEVARAE
jgi:PHD/YefM family antitoxin component YafN of YafNO toxin-antitoxin module